MRIGVHSLPPRNVWVPFLTRILALLSGTFGSALLGFVTQLLLARALNVADYGGLAALLAMVNIVGTFAGYGVGWFWLQVFGREGWAGFRWVTPTTRLIGIASATGVVLLGGYGVLTARGPLTSSLLVPLLLAPVLLGQSLAETTAARLQLEERYLTLAGWQSLTQMGRSAAVVLLIATGFRDLPHLLAGYALVGLTVTSIAALSLNQVRRGRIQLVGHDAAAACAAPSTAPRLSDAFFEATPFCFCTVFYLVYSQGVVVVVERGLGSQAAAIYNVAFLINSALYVIPQVVYMRYLAAKIFRWWTHDRRMFVAVFHVGIVANAVLGLACMTAVMTAAPLAIPMLFGDRYSSAVPVLIVLSTAIPIRFVQHTYGSAFFSEHNMKRKARYLGIAAATCVAASLLLIPRFGMAGAAMSTVFAEAVLLLVYARGVARYIDGIDVGSTFSLAEIRSSLAYIGGPGTRDRPNSG